MCVTPHGTRDPADGTTPVERCRAARAGPSAGGSVRSRESRRFVQQHSTRARVTANGLAAAWGLRVVPSEFSKMRLAALDRPCVMVCQKGHSCHAGRRRHELSEPRAKATSGRRGVARVRGRPRGTTRRRRSTMRPAEGAQILKSISPPKQSPRRRATDAVPDVGKVARIPIG